MKYFYFALLIILTQNVSAQNSFDTTAPFKRFPTVPPIRLLQTDSVTIFTKADLKKKKPVLLMLFSPDCDHCKHETEEILKHIDEFKHVQIVMATMSKHNQMKEFYLRYKLSDFKNIHVGQDFQFMLPSFYRASSLPYLAMYDSKGNLISTFQGTMKIEDLIHVFKK